MGNDVDLNIINPEAIDEFIGLMTRPGWEEVMHKALAKPLRKLKSLSVEITELPEDRPDWLTPERFASGKFFRFDPFAGQHPDRARIANVVFWLGKAGRRHRNLKGDGLGAAWYRRLDHIRTLEDAEAMAARDERHWASYWPPTQVARGCELVARNDLRAVGGSVASGYRWYEILSVAALRNEARDMGNCLHRSSYSDELREARARFFTLRGASMQPRLNARLTRCGDFQVERRSRCALSATDAKAVEVLKRSLGDGEIVRGLAAANNTANG